MINRQALDPVEFSLTTATLKIIVKQLFKWQIFMNIIFIDFRKAFYLGSIISKKYGSYDNIKARISKACQAFAML